MDDLFKARYFWFSITLVSLRLLRITPTFHPEPNDIIQLHPESQAVTLNSTVRLQCRVRMLVDTETKTGTQVYWAKNDFGIGGSREDVQEYGRSSRYEYSRYDLPYNLKEGQYDLQITNVELSDEGSYVCQVNYMKKQYLSQTAILTVQVPSEAPQLIQLTDEGKGERTELSQSKPAIVNDGSLMVLECVARHGKPGARLNWFIDGVPVVVEPGIGNKPDTFKASFSGNLTFKISPSIRIPRLVDSTSRMTAYLNKLHHGKLIECQAENAGYETHTLRSVQTKLEVQYAPVVSIQIRPTKVDNLYLEHDIVVLECSAHGRPSTFFWEWYMNGRKIDNIAESWYRLRLTKEMHHALFRCTAISNKKGYAETTLNIKFGPHFQEPSALLFTASLGENVVMDCPAFGNPTPQIEWRREGGREVLSRGITLKRENLQNTDFGTYVCTAYVPDFPPVSKQMYIAMKQPPRIQPNPIVHAYHGHAARLRCTVNSVPAPPIGQTHWYFHGHPVPHDSHHRFEREEFIGGVVLALYIPHVVLTDFGDYNCTVNNGYGSDWKIIRLHHQEDIPIQFIIGAAITVGVLVIIGLILLCICRHRVCGVKFDKKNQNQNVLHQSIQDYGVINSDFKPNIQVESPYHQEPFQFYISGDMDNTTCVNKSFAQFGGSELASEQHTSRAISNNHLDNCFYDVTKNEFLTNVSHPLGTNVRSSPAYNTCQFVQPICNGGTYISTFNNRLLSSNNAQFLAGCPTIFSSTGLVHACTPAFLPDSNTLQPTDEVCSEITNCPFSNNAHIAVSAVPQIRTLDLTNGMPSRASQGPCSGESASERSSFDIAHTPTSSHSTKKNNHSYILPEPNCMRNSDSHPQKIVNMCALSNSSIMLETNNTVPGIAYLINDHTTNV